MKHHTVLANCDPQTSMDKPIGYVAACMKYNILPKAVHIQGHEQVLADLLSRFRFHDHPTRVDPKFLVI
jgi:hypothetical protein